MGQNDNSRKTRDGRYNGVENNVWKTSAVDMRVFLTLKHLPPSAVVFMQKIYSYTKKIQMSVKNLPHYGSISYLIHTWYYYNMKIHIIREYTTVIFVYPPPHVCD